VNQDRILLQNGRRARSGASHAHLSDCRRDAGGRRALSCRTARSPGNDYAPLGRHIIGQAVASCHRRKRAFTEPVDTSDATPFKHVVKPGHHLRHDRPDRDRGYICWSHRGRTPSRSAEPCPSLRRDRWVDAAGFCNVRQPCAVLAARFAARFSCGRRYIAVFAGLDADIFEPGTISINEGERRDAEKPGDIAVFPLAFPLIASPGALSAVVLLTGRADDWTETAVIIVMICICLTITYFTMRVADALLRFLGQTVADVVGRISGVFLAGLAVQFFFDGLQYHPVVH
jgi:hypothetical protein